MKQNLTVHKIKSILKMLSLPIIVFLVMNTIDLMVTGQGVISSGTDVRALFRNILTTFSFALAINCNLRVGRMDLSLGSQMYLACIFGGNLALQMNLGGIGVLAFSMGLGLLCGLLVGTLYVQLRILPMIFGIGMSLFRGLQPAGTDALRKAGHIDLVRDLVCDHGYTGHDRGNDVSVPVQHLRL